MGAAAPGSARDSAALVLAADLAGTFVFAAQGALKAMAGDLDLFGVLVLAFVTALGGGIIRDLLIGAAPPNALRDWRYAAIAFVAGALAFALRPLVAQVPAWLVVGLDAAGLGLFAVAGAEKALSFGIPPFIAILMGGITGVGGGTIRDLLLMQIPVVLRVDVYATAALLGAVVVVVGRSLRLPDLRRVSRETSAGIPGVPRCRQSPAGADMRHWSSPLAQIRFCASGAVGRREKCRFTMSKNAFCSGYHQTPWTQRLEADAAAHAGLARSSSAPSLPVAQQ